MRFAIISALRQLFIPYGAVLTTAVLFLRWKLQADFAPPGGQFIALALCIVAILLAWRLRSPRLVLTSIILLIAERAWLWGSLTGSAHAAIAVLLPVNVAVLLLVDDTYFDWEALGWWGGLIAVQALVLGVTEGLGEAGLLRGVARPILPWLSRAHRVPHVAMLLFAATGLALLTAFWFSRKPRDSGMLWALCASFLALDARSLLLATAYFATAALIVAISVIETAYLVGYHDELTGLPARRAFNQAVAALDGQYSIAMLDVDHFKQFNDTYGHDVGDQVLRMVGSKMMRAAAEGKVFRYGGEEFAIIFRDRNAEETFEHADALRRSIAGSSFVVRGPARSHRSRNERRYRHKKRKLRKQRYDTRVTVSVGVAEPGHPDMPVEDVIQAADRALYQAKSRGRNRVEMFATRRAAAPRAV